MIINQICWYWLNILFVQNIAIFFLKLYVKFYIIFMHLLGLGLGLDLDLVHEIEVYGWL